MAVAQARDARERARPTRLAGSVVTHTHWDREWYLSFERFRMRMVDMLELVLDTFDARDDFRAFMLDGQTVLIEDHLDIRPEDETRIAKHVRAGRLVIGPFYGLPDGFIVSAETLVRNLLIGDAIARRYGEPMPVGYIPDPFGHPSQYPQLLRGFGIDAAALWRGVDATASELEWEAPDGSRVYLVSLGKDGYCNANVLSSSPHLFPERMKDTIERLAVAATTPHVLIMNGCDHMSPRPDLADAIAALNAREDLPITLEQVTLAEHVGRVREANPAPEVVRGELRSGRLGHVLPGVISTRMYLKQENFRTATLLERGAEPLAALAWRTGERYPASQLTYAWKIVLQNGPHDSVTGCSVDRVHRDMLSRYAAAQDVAGDLAYRAAGALARRVATSATSGPATYVTVNVVPRARREHIREKVHFLEPGASFHVRGPDGRSVASQLVARAPATIDFSARFESFDRDGKEYPVLLGITHDERTAILGEKRWQRWEGEEVDLLFDAELPACGYATFTLVRGEDPAPAPTDLRYGDDWAENEHVRVDVRADGTFDLLDKRTGARFSGLGALESGGDRGDEYTFCDPEEDEVVSSRGARGTVRRVEEGPVRVTFEVGLALDVPARLADDRRRRSSDRVALPIVTRISVGAGHARVEIATGVTNTAEDHRLRALFAVPFATDAACAQGQFTVERRSVDPAPWHGEGEPPARTFPQRAFADVSDGTVGLAVLNRGLTEAEVRRAGTGTELCLTLLRCVGWLSRGDLHTRPGDAGSRILTPEAQCPGYHLFEYAVLPHAGDWLAGEVHVEAEDYVTPVHSASTPGLPEVAVHSELALSPAEMVWTALKRSEDGEALVLRAYNTAPHAVRARLSLGRAAASVALADLAERETVVLAREPDGSYAFDVRPNGICTVRIV